MWWKITEGGIVIFVFGSNLAGRHGKGAALYARNHRGAIYGQGEGLQGESYAIPTKDERLRPRELSEIATSIRTFVEFSQRNNQLEFEITPVGCGLAGFLQSVIRPLFEGVGSNCHFTKDWTV